MNNFYTLLIDENLADSLEKFKSNLPPGEKVISTASTNEGLVITTELNEDSIEKNRLNASRGRSRNLLLEELPLGFRRNS